MEEDIRILCENFKKLRRAYNLSKKKMAKRLRIGVKSLTMVENGILPQRMTCEVLFTIQKEFGIEPYEMFLKDLEIYLAKKV